MARPLARVEKPCELPETEARDASGQQCAREAHGVDDTLHPDRLVFGVQSAEAEARLREVFATPIGEGTPVVVCNLPTAELVSSRSSGAASSSAARISLVDKGLFLRSRPLY